LWVVFAFLDPDPDCESRPGYGFRDPLNPDPQHRSFLPGHTPRWLRRRLIVGNSTIRRPTTVQILVLAPVRTDVSEIDVVQALHAPNDHVQLIVVGPADMSQLKKHCTMQLGSFTVPSDSRRTIHIIGI
jgi:hypothetical protein